MRRRLYFLLRDTAQAKRVVNELLLARVEAGHIHVLAKQGTPLEDLPEAGLLQKSDFVHGVEQGLALGGLTGAIVGVVLIAVAPSGLDLNGVAVLTMALAGALMGGWASGMIATDVPNSRLKRFKAAIEQGEVLMMVDIPKTRVQEVTALIRSHHPEAGMHGTEPTIPAFP
ncbi:MAG: DUF1269 domain-containing protein [Chromatiales bacterium 21-64-14]|nr:MAG: DUF1269 domain-containing protein [Chromatiales bacterium 21-64-14]HQU16495.1 DUF1269 domain-containing protein [Gammaproteobacteria bacterium]